MYSYIVDVSNICSTGKTYKILRNYSTSNNSKSTTIIVALTVVKMTTLSLRYDQTITIVETCIITLATSVATCSIFG